MIALLLALGCPRTPSPPVWSIPVPDLPAPPERPTPVRDPQACPGEASYVVSRPAPWVDPDGHPICNANLIPTDRVLSMLADADDLEHWRSVAQICHAHRVADRSWSQDAISSCRMQAEATAIDLRVTRTALPVSFAAGLVIGLGTAVVIQRIP